jgi:hypothetical protein
MNTEGPPLESLTRRLAECPAEFLLAPRVGDAGSVHVAAVVSDLLRDLGGPPLTPTQAAAFESRQPRRDRNRLSVVLLACWLLHDDWFRACRPPPADLLALLTSGLAAPAAVTSAEHFVSDPDRREELARWCLRALGLRPAGETIAQAQDRLATLNAAERQRLIEAARAAEARAAAIREAMRQREVEEANAKMMRE